MDLLEKYNKDGYVIINDFAPKKACNQLIERATTLVENDETNDRFTFSESDQSQAKTQYFLDSANNISLFYEPDSLNETGQPKYDKKYCINKIGHALHAHDIIFANFTYSEKIKNLASKIGISTLDVIQSMYIFKQPYIGNEVTCHQDSTFLFVKNRPVTGFWLALEDAKIENGCMWAIPGGHLSRLKSRMIRHADDNIETQIYDDTPWDNDKLTPLEVKQGSLIILHGLLPHLSKQNTSSASRHAYTFHAMSAGDDYAEDNWLQRSKR